MKTTSIHLHRHSSRFNENNHYAAGDLNRNAMKSQADYQRDACEQELYRLRYGIEQLLANKEQGDVRNGYKQSPLGRMKSRMNNWINWKNKSWFERCTPCCRRWRNQRNNNPNNINEYNTHDPNYDSSSRKSSKSAPQTSRHNDSFFSTSRSPSISSTPYMNSNIDSTKNNFKQIIPNINDPVYQSSILKILEAKALDCLCTGYSKDNTQKQITRALSEINQRTADQQYDSGSVSSSRLSKSNRSGSRSVSSSRKHKGKKKSSKSRSRTPSTRRKTSSSNKSRTKKISSSKHRRKPSSIHRKKSSSKHGRKQSSKHRKPSSSAHRNKSTKTRIKSKKNSSSSRSKQNKHSSNRTNKKHQSKHRKKRIKAKSNNQINVHEMISSSYQNRQRLLQILLSST